MKPTAFNLVRTSIAGHRLGITFGTCHLDHGVTFQVRVQLSLHPALGARRMFGAPAVATDLTGRGLVGEFALPTPTQTWSCTLGGIPGVSTAR